MFTGRRKAAGLFKAKGTRPSMRGTPKRDALELHRNIQECEREPLDSVMRRIQSHEEFREYKRDES